MPTLDEIELQLQHIEGSEKILDKKSIKELPKILWTDEQIKKIIQGTYSNKAGILVATNKRLVFVNKGMAWGITVQDFLYDKMNSIKYETGLILGTITIMYSEGNVEVGHVDKKQCGDFCNYVSTHLANKVAYDTNSLSKPLFSATIPNFETISANHHSKLTFYKKGWFMWVMLICCYPIGAFLMCRNKSYSKYVKIFVLCFMGFIFVSVLTGDDGSPVKNDVKTVQRESTTSAKSNHKPELIKWFKSLNNEIQLSTETGTKIGTLFSNIANGTTPIGNESVTEINKIYEEYKEISKRMDNNYPAPEFMNETDKKNLNSAVYMLSSANEGYGASLYKLTYRIKDGTFNEKHIKKFYKEFGDNTDTFQESTGKIADILGKYGIERSELQKIMDDNSVSK